MKVLQFSVVLLLVCISCAEALKCNYCVPARGGSSCITREETCRSSLDVCIRAVFKQNYSYFKRCIKEADAFTLDASPYIDVYTCSTDLCN